MATRRIPLGASALALGKQSGCAINTKALPVNTRAISKRTPSHVTSSRIALPVTNAHPTIRGLKPPGVPVERSVVSRSQVLRKPGAKPSGIPRKNPTELKSPRPPGEECNVCPLTLQPQVEDWEVAPRRSPPPKNDCEVTQQKSPQEIISPTSVDENFKVSTPKSFTNRSSAEMSEIFSHGHQSYEGFKTLLRDAQGFSKLEDDLTPVSVTHLYSPVQGQVSTQPSELLREYALIDESDARYKKLILKPKTKKCDSYEEVSTPSCCDELFNDLVDYSRSGKVYNNYENPPIIKKPPSLVEEEERRDSGLKVKLTSDQLKKAMTGDLVVRLLLDSKHAEPTELDNLNLAEQIPKESYKVMVETNKVPEILKDVFGPDWDGTLPESVSETKQKNKELLAKAYEKAGETENLLDVIHEESENIEDLECPPGSPPSGSTSGPPRTSVRSPSPRISFRRTPIKSPQVVQTPREERWWEKVVSPVSPSKRVITKYSDGLFQDTDPYDYKLKPDVELAGPGGPIKLADLYAQGYEKPIIPEIVPWVRPPDTPPRPPPTTCYEYDEPLECDAPALISEPAPLIEPYGQTIPAVPVPIGEWIADNNGRIPDKLTLVLPSGRTGDDQIVNYNADIVEPFDPLKPVTARDALKDLLPLAPVIDELIKMESEAQNKLEHIINEFDPLLTPNKNAAKNAKADKQKVIRELVAVTPAITELIKNAENKKCEQLEMSFEKPKRAPPARLLAQRKHADEPPAEPACAPQPICPPIVADHPEVPEEEFEERVCAPPPHVRPPPVAPRRGSIINQKVNYGAVESKVNKQLREDKARLEARAPLMAAQTQRGKIINQKLTFRNVRSKVDYAVPETMAARDAAKEAAEEAIREPVKKCGPPGTRGTIINEPIKRRAVQSKIVSTLDPQIQAVRDANARKRIINKKMDLTKVKSKVSSNAPTAAGSKTYGTTLPDPDEPDPKSKYCIDYTKSWQDEVARLTEEAVKEIHAENEAQELYLKQEKERLEKMKVDEALKKKRAETFAEEYMTADEKIDAIKELLSNFDNDLAYDIEYKYMRPGPIKINKV